MIKRISRLKYIGRFYDSRPAGIAFAKETLIYGANGSGKSTIVAVLKSLASGQAKFIKSKKSFDASGQQVAEIHCGLKDEDKVYVFENEKWNNVNNNVLIFDDEFISNNIYDSDSICDKNKANLHRIIVGPQGKAIAEEIKKIEANITAAEISKNQKVATFSLTGFKNFVLIDDFLKLSEDKEVEKKTSNVESEIAFAKQLRKPQELTFRVPDFLSLQRILSKGFKSSHEKAEKIVKKQIEESWSDHLRSVSFLKEGLGLISQRKKCPFCGKNLLDMEELIKNYQIYFDDEYLKLQAEIKSTSDKFKQWNVENYLTYLLSEAKSWSDYIGNDHYEDLHSFINKIEQEILKEKRIIDEEFTKKQQNINYVVDLSELVNLEKNWRSIEAQVRDFNKKISVFVSSTKSKNLRDLEKEREILRINKARCLPKWIDFIEKYKLDLKTIDDRKKKRTDLLKDLSDYSVEVFKNHQNKINEILQEMDADFKIKNLSEEKDLRKSDSVFCGFEIEFFGKHTVKIDNNEDDLPSFKTTLSKGDKSALAFAFFLSLLNQDSDLENKTLIFDDPVSSFDEDRELSTVNLIADIKNAQDKVPSQKIIFTHEKTFLIKLFKEPRFANAKCIKLVPDGTEKTHGNKLTKLEDLNVFEEFIKELEFVYLEQVKEYLEGNTSIPEDAYEKFRVLLEEALKAKYYVHLIEVIKARSGVGGYMKVLVEKEIYTQEKVKSFSRILGKLQEIHHSSPLRRVAPNTQGDIKTILRGAIDMLEEV